MVAHVIAITDVPVVPDSCPPEHDATTVHDLVGWAGFLGSERPEPQHVMALVGAADADPALLRDALVLARRMLLMGETGATAVELLRLAAHEAGARPRALRSSATAT